MRLTLTADERMAIRVASMSERRVRHWRRYKAIWLLSKGVPPQAVATVLDCSLASVYNWVQAWRESGLEGLQEATHQGRDRMLDDDAESMLASLMRTEPAGHGYEASGWTVPLLQQELTNRGVQVSERTIRRTLHRLGWRWDLSQYVYEGIDGDYKPTVPPDSRYVTNAPQQRGKEVSPSAGRARLPYVGRDDLPGKKAIWDEIARHREKVSGIFQLLLNNPDVTRHVAAVGEYFRQETLLPARWRALTFLLASRELGNRYEYDEHRRMAEKVGLSPEFLASVEKEESEIAPDSDDAIVLTFVRELLRQHEVSEETFQRAFRLLGRERLIDLTVLLGYVSMLSLVVTAFDVREEPAADKASGSPRSKRGPNRSQPMPPVHQSGSSVLVHLSPA
jgi:4-carboxymuconolactone decarboxylase